MGSVHISATFPVVRAIPIPIGRENTWHQRRDADFVLTLRWSKLTPLQRSKYMYKFAEVLSERAEGLQRKLSENTGHSDCAEELDNCIKAAFKWAGSCGTDAWSSVSFASWNFGNEIRAPGLTSWPIY